MNRMMKVCSVGVAVMLAGSVCMAQHRGNNYRGDYRGRGDYGRHSYQGYSDRGSHYGYYRNARGDLFFGLLGVGIAAAIVSSIDRPVYLQPPVQVVYQPTPVVYLQQPQTVYVQQPQTVYVQQPQVVQQPEPSSATVQPPEAVRPPVVVQQELPVVQTPPVTMTVNLQNSDGSFTPVTLRQAGPWWIGPKGEYYRDGIPTVGQLRPLYGR